MGDGYQVRISSLDKHEQDVRTIMEQVSGAVNTVREPFDVAAFGILGSIWSGALNAWIEGHTGMVDSAIKAGDDVADSVGKMSQNYQQNESDVAQSFTSIHNDMQGE
jgi:hypothetical protein